MSEYSEEMKEDIKELIERGGEIHLLCPAATGASCTHTHIKIEKGMAITCRENYLRVNYPENRDTTVFIIPYSSIAYIYIKKKR